ncbi:MAG TPA: hypothetical protein VMR70_14475 [Flavisolibacter sp.]|nr:hypothetical protein [Flavisolibacter sp.]
MKNFNPDTDYQQQLVALTAQLNGLEKKRKQLGWLRLVIFLLTIVVAYNVFVSYGLAGLLPTVLGIGFLLYLVSVDVANNAKIRNTKTLIRINEEEREALQHRFQQREDGRRFASSEHVYANDLDIFGESSVYQWVSRSYTEQGQRLLANNLLQAISLEEIKARQEAVKELAANLSWRQQWQAFAMHTTVTHRTEEKIDYWLKEEKEHFTGGYWKWAVLVYTFITLGTAIAAIVGLIPGVMFSSLYLFFLVFSMLLSRNAVQTYSHLNGIVKETSTLETLVSWLESLSSNSRHVQQLQASIKTSSASAGKEVKALKNILDRFDLRNSMFGPMFFNAFLLWDVRQMIALNAWRKRNSSKVYKWFAAVAEMEVLHSVSTLHFNHPDWSFPTFTSNHFTLEGKEIGHPLLPAGQRVNNSFSINGIGKIGLITGSNMAGKSTFLRSLGVNMVLAQMGAPVCAASFVLSPVQLVSSMRIADNLAENTSTFYAELKKLRTIIEMVKTHQPLFILLDEILRGTNSFDRHKGSAALIKQLIKEDAVAVIATHDVELTLLKETYPSAIENYHFDVEVEGEELYFDYKLKHGICKSLNASILMKKIGIDIPD